MTSVTGTWQIPYPDSTDRLCDGYTIIDSMADRLDLLLGQFTDDLARVEVIPYASIHTDVDQSFSTNLPGFGSPQLIISYDTVFADTVSWTNLAILPAMITVRPAGTASGGYFAVVLNIRGFTNNAAGTSYFQSYMAVNSTATDPGATVYGEDGSVNMGGTAVKMFPTNVPAQLFSEMRANNLGQPTATLTSASFIAFWVADQ